MTKGTQVTFLVKFELHGELNKVHHFLNTTLKIKVQTFLITQLLVRYVKRNQVYALKHVSLHSKHVADPTVLNIAS